MSDNQRFSRTERHEKRKRNKRKVLFFGSLAAVFFIVLFSLIVFGGSDSSNDTASNDSTENETNVEEQEENDTPNDTETESTEDKQDDDSEDPVNQTDVEDRVEKENDDNDDNNDDVDVEEVASDDSNVIQAYEGDWDPVGTNQQGEHTTNYETDSEDRQEIKKAVSQVTEVPEDNIIEHWVGNNGDQKVVATIQDESTAEYYRVYLQWEDDKGWKPTKYEEIKSNDAN